MGYGESVPLAHISGETVESVLDAVERAGRLLDGRTASSFRRLSREIAEALPGQIAARAGVETAMMDAFARSRKASVWQWLGGSTGHFSTDVTIPICEPARAAELAAQAAADGFELLKLKVGREDDAERLARVSASAPSASFILDANQAFDPGSAATFLRSLPFDSERVKVFEQPVKAEDIAGLKRASGNSPVPVYADESVKNPVDALELVRVGAARGINVKVQKSGILGALDIAAICRAAGLELMIGCMLETAVGLSASAHLACGLGDFRYADLDSDLLIAEDIGTPGFVRKGPEIAILDLPGFGAQPPAGVFDS